MAIPVWRGLISGGRLHFEERGEFDAFASTLEGKRFELTLRKERTRLSGNQRGYLHGVVLPIMAKELGHRSPTELKAILKLKLLWDGESVDKAGLPVIPSTEDLTAQQYGEFIDACVQIASECSIYIPPPGEAVK